MALNSLGLGFVFKAKDLATPTMGRVTGKFQRLDKVSTRAANRVNTGLGSMRGAMDGVGSTSARMEQGMSSLRNAGLAMGVAGGLVLRSLAGTAKEAVEFEKSIINIKTLSGAAGQSTDELAASVRAMGVEFGQDTTIAASALYNAVSAGANTAAKQQDLLTASNKLAVAGLSDVETTGTAVAAVIQGLGLEFSDSSRVADSMFTAVDKGVTTVDKLARNVGQVTSKAGQLGLEVEETFAAFAAITQVETNTAKAATLMEATLRGFIKPAEKAKKAAKEAGFSMGPQFIRDSGGLVPALKRMQNEFGLTQDTIVDFFEDSEAISGVSILMRNNFEGVNGALDAMENKVGKTDREFKRLEGSLDFQIKRFAALRKDVRLTIGEALAPFISKLIDIGTRAVQMFRRLDPSTKEMIVRFATIAAAVLTASGAVMALSGTVGQAVIGLRQALPLLLPLAKILLPIVAVALLAVGAVKLFRFAFENNLGGIRDFLGPIIDKVSLFFRALKQLFTDGFVSGDVLDDLQKVENEGVLSLLGAVVRLGFRLKKFVEGVAEGFRSVIVRMGPTVKKLVEAIQRLGEAIGLTGDDVNSFVKGPSQEFLNAGKKVGEFLGNLVEFVVLAMATWINVYSKAIEIFKDGLDLIQPIFDTIGETFDEITTKLDTLANELGFAGGAGEALAAVFEVVGTIIGAVWTGIVTGLSLAVLATTKILSGMISALTFVVTAFKDAKNGIVSAWDGVVEFFRKVWNGIKIVIDDMITTLVQVGSAIPEGLRPEAVNSFIQQRTQGLDIEIPDTDNFGFAGPVPVIPAVPPGGVNGSAAEQFDFNKKDESVEAIAERMAAIMKDFKVSVNIDGEKVAEASARGDRINRAGVFGATPGVGD